MSLTFKMVASEILMCGLKKVPVAGHALEVVEAIRSKHELAGYVDRLDDVESQLTRFEKRQRALVAEEMRSILETLGSPNLGGPALTEEIRNLRQIQDQGWNPNLFEGLLLNSSHRDELKRNPQHYGRILDDYDPVDLAKGIYLLLDVDKTRLLELPPFAFAQLLANQSKGIPEAKIRVGDGVWAFPGIWLTNERDTQAQTVIDRFQWVTAATVFINSIPTLDLMADGAVKYQMILELAAVYGVDLTTEVAQMHGTLMILRLQRLGMVEATTSLFAGLFKSSMVGYAAGGAVQCVSMAYLTRVSGLTFREYFSRDQAWGDGGMKAALVGQFDLNSRPEFLQRFAAEAFDKVISRALKGKEHGSMNVGV